MKLFPVSAIPPCCLNIIIRLAKHWLSVLRQEQSCHLRARLGQGRTDYLANLIVSQDISELRVDVNAGVTRRGFKEEDLDQYRYNWAIAASHPITERWGMTTLTDNYNIFAGFSLCVRLDDLQFVHRFIDKIQQHHLAGKIQLMK